MYTHYVLHTHTHELYAILCGRHCTDSYCIRARTCACSRRTRNKKIKDQKKKIIIIVIMINNRRKR